jgi:hypothetical protein
MKNFTKIIICFSTLIVLWNCGNNCNHSELKPLSHTNSISGYIIADTITYDVIIKNVDSSKVWNEEFLKYVKRSMIIDSIFAGVYSGRFKPYEFFSGKKLSLKEVKQIEAEDWFSRDAIGKIQFSEVWYSKPGNFSIEKKVFSVVLGVEQFDQFGNLKGYKPVFKVYLN